VWGGGGGGGESVYGDDEGEEMSVEGVRVYLL